jgi:hypothetical protein
LRRPLGAGRAPSRQPARDRLRCTAHAEFIPCLTDSNSSKKPAAAAISRAYAHELEELADEMERIAEDRDKGHP